MNARVQGLLNHENWIGGLPPDVRAELISRCTTIDVPAGRELGRAGEPCPGIYQVVQGHLKLLGRQEDGRQVLITVYAAGNCFAETTIVARRAFNHTTQALTATQVRLLPAAQFWDLYNQHRAIADALCFKFASAIGRQLAGREQRAAHRLGKRIALMLENLCDHGGERYLDGSVLLPLPITQTDIAEHFDVTRQTVQREMSEMKEAGLLTRQGDLWLIHDRQRLAVWNGKL